MIRYKLLKDCKEGEWVYYEIGRLCQVQDGINSITNEPYKELTDGCIRIYTSPDSKVYPITIHAKNIADSIYSYYREMSKKGLINGGKWVNWLSDKFDELMALDDNAEKRDYRSIYKSIEDQIENLEYHKSFL